MREEVPGFLEGRPHGSVDGDVGQDRGCGLGIHGLNQLGMVVGGDDRIRQHPNPALGFVIGVEQRSLDEALVVHHGNLGTTREEEECNV